MGLIRRADKATPRRNVQSAAVSTATLSLLSTAGVAAGRDRAMRVPTISRARDMFAGLVASTPFVHIEQSWSSGTLTERTIEPEPWMIRPDDDTTRAHILGWTVDDLLFSGFAVWQVTRRYADGRPRSFRWIPADLVEINTPLRAGNYPVGGITDIRISGRTVDPADLVIFYGSQAPLLETGSRAIVTAERLELAAQRFATNPVGMVTLRQTGGEPMTGEELADLASAWVEMRSELAVAAVNEFTEVIESTASPDRLQAVESRQHQALELARIANISPFLVGAPTGSGMTYANAQQAREQLLQDALPFLTVIEETLSAIVLPRGRIVRFDRTVAESTVGGNA